jgi:hypothetical protein
MSRFLGPANGPYIPPSAAQNGPGGNNNGWNAANNNNGWNAANNNDDGLDDLFFQASMIIGTYESGQDVNYNDLSSILHDIMIHPRIDNVAVNGSEESSIISRLQAIQNAIATGLHSRNRYSRIPNRGRLSVPKGSTNVTSFNTIKNGNQMINFQGEKGFNHYFRKNQFNQFQQNAQGLKKNPLTRTLINPSAGNIYTYTADVSANLNENLAKINTSLFTKRNVSIGAPANRRSNTNNNFVSNLTNGGKGPRKTRTSKKSKKTRKHKK